MFDCLLYGTSLAFLITGNWYCGLWAIFHSWFALPGMLVRLHGGTKIILFHRVLSTAFSIFHLLLFFIVGTGSILVLINGNQLAYR